MQRVIDGRCLTLPRSIVCASTAAASRRTHEGVDGTALAADAIPATSMRPARHAQRDTDGLVLEAACWLGQDQLDRRCRGANMALVGIVTSMSAISSKIVDDRTCLGLGSGWETWRSDANSGYVAMTGQRVQHLERGPGRRHSTHHARLSARRRR